MKYLGSISDNKDLVNKGYVDNLIAPAYSSSSAYSVGQGVIYNNKLYKCNTAIPSPGETWTSAHWTEVKMANTMDDVSELKSAITNYAEGVLPYSLVTGEYIKDSDGAFTAYSGWSRTGYIACNKYSKLHCVTSAQSKYNAFYDSSKTFISSFAVKTTAGDIAVPDGAYYVAFSNTNAGMANFECTFKTIVENDINRLDAIVPTKADDIRLDRLLYNQSVHSNFPFTWTIGTINTANGNTQSSTTAIRSTYLNLQKGDVVGLNTPGNYDYRVFRYDASTYDSSGSITTFFDAPFTIQSKGQYRFVICKKTREDISDNEVATISADFYAKSDEAFWNQYDQMEWTGDAIYYSPDFYYGGIYASNGSRNNSKYYLTTMSKIHAWIGRIKPPNGIRMIFYAFNKSTGLYSGIWNGTELVTGLSTIYYFDDWTVLPDSLKNENDVYLVVSKLSEESFDTTALTGFTIKTVYDELVGSKKSVTTTVLGYDLPDDIAEFNVSRTYAEAMKEAIEDWGSDYAGDDTKVPFILHTDQHGRLNSANKGVFDLLNYLVNWDNVSAIFNLGDTVVDHWEDDDTNENPLLRNATLEAALKCISSIPADKQINVFGNHDTWYSGNEPTTVANVLPSLKYNNPYFIPSGLRTIKHPDNSGLMCAYDDRRKIRYLVVTDWDYAAKDNPNYQYFYVSKTHWEWIIAELEKDTGYDLVIVSHIPLLLGSSIAVNPITGASATQTTVEKFITQTTTFDDVWTNRKNKTSGSITVGGETISYDFTNCKDNCLCALSGHQHNDVVDYCKGTTGLLTATFDWFANRTIHFGIIDRANNQLKVWKLHNESNTPGVEMWTAPFIYSAPQI